MDFIPVNKDDELTRYTYVYRTWMFHLSALIGHVNRCTVSSVQKRHVAIARLRSPANLGRTSQEVWFIILVVTSTKEVKTSLCPIPTCNFTLI